jgi:hypothetical protein
MDLGLASYFALKLQSLQAIWETSFDVPVYGVDSRFAPSPAIKASGFPQAMGFFVHTIGFLDKILSDSDRGTTKKRTHPIRFLNRPTNFSAASNGK